MGATTIWERWDSMLPDGTINPGQMTSFNHYAFGAIGDWLHRVVAGLAPDAPGYERIRIAPHPLEGFDFASAEHLTPYGTARAAWTRERRRHPHRSRHPAEHDGDGRAARRQHARGGFGRARMGVAAAAGAVPPAHVGLESSLAAVIDDPEAYGVILDVLEAGKPAAAHAFRTTTQWMPGRDLGEAHLPADRSGAAAAPSRIDSRICRRLARRR